MTHIGWFGGPLFEKPPCGDTPRRKLVARALLMTLLMTGSNDNHWIPYLLCFTGLTQIAGDVATNPVVSPLSSGLIWGWRHVLNDLLLSWQSIYKRNEKSGLWICECPMTTMASTPVSVPGTHWLAGKRHADIGWHHGPMCGLQQAQLWKPKENVLPWLGVPEKLEISYFGTLCTRKIIWDHLSPIIKHQPH